MPNPQAYFIHYSQLHQLFARISSHSVTRITLGIRSYPLKEDNDRLANAWREISNILLEPRFSNLVQASFILLGGSLYEKRETFMQPLLALKNVQVLNASS